MDALVRPVVDPGFAAAALAFLCGGVALGTASGLVPGLHANNFALLLAGLAPSVSADPLLVGVAMLGAGVVHSFLDIVPALALGVPDAATAVAALPGHRLVVAGRGREAVRLSAVGSGLAVALAVPLAIPITWVMIRGYPVVRNHLPLLLGGVVAFLVLTESSKRAAIGGLVAFLASAALGFATLDVDPAAPLDAGGVLAPLFAGLFGAPVLIDAMGGGGVPPQADARIAMSRRGLGISAGGGSLAGAVVGYVPGISAAIAAVAALPAVPREESDRGFVVATSGANTANTIFALFALVALGTPRTGVTVAIDRAEVPFALRSCSSRPRPPRRAGSRSCCSSATRTSESSGTRTTRGCRSACWRCSWGYPTRSLAQSGSACSSSPGRWGSSRRGSARDGCT